MPSLPIPRSTTKCWSAAGCSEVADTRKTLWFVGERSVELRDEPLAAPGPDEVVVEAQFSAISPGSELLVYRGDAPSHLQADEKLSGLWGTLDFPLRYGYSWVGKVCGRGSRVDSSWDDRLVFAFQPHASHATLSLDELVPVPDGVNAEAAALLPSVETALSLVMDGRPMIGERVVVLGQGVVGLITAALLSRLSLESLITVEPVARRRSLSLEVGAELSLDPAAGGFARSLATALGDSASADEVPTGADLCYELTGQPATLDTAIRVTGRWGRIVIGSWYGTRRAPIDLGGQFHRSGIELIPSQVSHLAPRHRGRWTRERRLETAWRLLRRLPVSSLITQRVDAARAQEAFSTLDENPEEAVQVLLAWNRQESERRCTP